MLNKTPESSNITLDDFDPSLEWVVETQEPTFGNEDLSWMDLDPSPPLRLGESSWNLAIESQSTYPKDEFEEDDEDADSD